MADGSKIQWTDATWTPIAAFHRKTDKRGWFCTKPSAGCKHCYSEALNLRLGTGLTYTAGNAEKVELRLVNLDQPLRWRRPRRIFVCSMTDLFHENHADEWIDQVFAVMALAPWHTFQILTKRAKRMREYMTKPVSGPWAGRFTIVDDHGEREGTDVHFRLRMGGLLPLLEKAPAAAINRASAWQEERFPDGDGFLRQWPLPNVHLGVSVEDQARADERVPELLQTPAAIRFVSAEPLLGPIDFEKVPLPSAYLTMNGIRGVLQPTSEKDTEPDDYRYFTRQAMKLDWVIVGGESGAAARPCDISWIRSVVEQCSAAQAHCFVKQLGANRWENGYQDRGHTPSLDHVRDRKGGDPEEWPVDLRIREFPEARA